MLQYMFSLKTRKMSSEIYLLLSRIYAVGVCCYTCLPLNECQLLIECPLK